MKLDDYNKIIYSVDYLKHYEQIKDMIKQCSEHNVDVCDLIEQLDVSYELKQYLIHSVKFFNVKIKELTSCQAGTDGECNDVRCPQVRDGEPQKTRRFCPLPHWTDDEDY